MNSMIDHIKSSIIEDVGFADITANILDDKYVVAKLIFRQDAVLCGVDYFDLVFKNVDKNIKIEWYFTEGDKLNKNQKVAEISGNVKSILSAERVAINYLQTLSAVATKTRQYVNLVANYKAKIFDTRKTIPGLRKAQKHAVTIGGGHNQRMGLYDAFLIKENHISALGSITECVNIARSRNNGFPIQVEVESLSQLKEALQLDVDLILLDNFTLEQIKQAVKINQNKAKIEVSGNVNLSNIEAIAKTGVDRISIGDLTKSIQAIDISLLIKNASN